MLRDPETGRPFELLPAEITFLEHALELNEDGTARFPELIYSAPKKSGKTVFAAILLRDRARITNREITFPDIGATITAIASDAAGSNALGVGIRNNNG